MKHLRIVWLGLILLGGNAMALNEKTIYGYVEKATLMEKNLTLSAKLDTGAKSASLYAVKIEEFEKDDTSYLRFTVPDKRGSVTFEAEYVGRVKIKARAGERPAASPRNSAIRRPVVRMKVRLGTKEREILVNLTNRKQFNYPLL